MANKATTPSLQDILRKRQQSEFVGRTQQVADFRANLRYDVTDERRKFIFSISGQGGVGKTWLARRLRKIAEEFGAITALTDEAENDVPSAMGRIAEQLEEQSHPLKAFSERYKVYRQRKQELEADPDAPQGLTAFVTRTVVDVGFDLLELTPAGAVTKHLPKEILATQASEWAEFVRRKLANKDETRLVLEPIPVLTPLWLAGLTEVAQEHPLALFLDTYERTCPHLDPWLREMLDGRHGTVPATIVWTISGRDALDDNDWAPYRGLVAVASLEPFSEEEAREYLNGKGITDPKIVEAILRLSGRLPLLVATLATQSPSDAEHVEDPVDTAVERFLKWVDDPVQRRAALHGALPRRLNQDILACLEDLAGVEPLFAWLQTMPFVQKRGDYWEYHEVVRSSMLRYLRTQSPKTWADLHRRLAEHYETAREGLGLNEEQGRKDSAWQELALEALYHRLCQSPKANLPVAINGFLAALKAQQSFACRWAEILHLAGEEASAVECATWGARLVDGMAAYQDDNHDAGIGMFTAVLEYPALEPALKPLALSWRGRIHSLAGNYVQGIADLSEAIRLAPEVTEYWADRGSVNLRKQEFAAALADFDRAIAIEPYNSWVVYSRGATYYMIDQYDKALADLDQAIVLSPKLHVAHEYRGMVLQDLDRYEEAISAYSEAKRSKPDCHSCLGNRGSALRDVGRYEDALVDLDRAIGLSPNCATCITNRGKTYLKMEHYEKALADFEQAVGIDPTRASVIAYRGETYRKMKQYDRALADFDRAIALKLDSHWAHERRGMTLASLGRDEEAVAAYDEAERRGPDCHSCLGNRGFLFQRMGRYEEALVDLERATSMDPDCASCIGSRGQTYRQIGQVTTALADFERALKLDPNDEWLHYQRALTWLVLSEPTKAAADLDTATAIARAAYERNSHAWTNTLNLALYRLIAGDQTNAEALYRQRLDEGVAQGFLIEAVQDLDEVLRLIPGHAGATAARALLTHSQS